MNGKAQSIVAAVVIAMLGWIITDQRALRSEVTALRAELHRDIAGLHEDIAELRERMARLEGLFEGFTKREATP